MQETIIKTPTAAYLSPAVCTPAAEGKGERQAKTDERGDAARKAARYQGRILLTGATGYVGGRLLQALEREGYSLRCVVRQPARLGGRTRAESEIVAGDCLDAASLESAMDGIHTAYYLVHSMGHAASFEEQDRKAAENFSAAAEKMGVRRIIYLGGLGGGPLSSHLRSRQEVGAILRRSSVPVVEFRASIVIGSGSLSFEMIRALVERLPVMICPRWVAVAAQPIAIEDLIRYLVDALKLVLAEGQIIDIGGPERVSYLEIMREYARQRGLKRWMISIPVLTPRLSSLWLGLVTPLYARVGRKLIDSIRNETVVTNDSALRLFAIQPMGLAEMMRRALLNEDREFAMTRWSDALSSSGLAGTRARARFGNRIVDSRTIAVRAPAAAAFRPIRRIGGTNGWYFGDWLWELRGFVDLLWGGVGLRRGRRDPETLRIGEPLDFWRVEDFDEPRRLLLSAEMKLPGRAWLEFEVKNQGTSSVIRQTAIFESRGLAGLAYGYALYPLHCLMFAHMLRRIAARAESEA